MATFADSTPPKTPILTTHLVLPAIIIAALAATAIAGVVHVWGNRGNHRSDTVARNVPPLPAVSTDEVVKMQSRLDALSAQTKWQAKRLDSIDKYLAELSPSFNELLQSLEEREEYRKKLIADVGWLLQRDIDTSIAMQELAKSFAMSAVITETQVDLNTIDLGSDAMEEMNVWVKEIVRRANHSVLTFRTFQSQWKNHCDRADVADCSLLPVSPIPLDP